MNAKCYECQVEVKRNYALSESFLVCPSCKQETDERGFPIDPKGKLKKANEDSWNKANTVTPIPRYRPKARTGKFMVGDVVYKPGIEDTESIVNDAGAFAIATLDTCSYEVLAEAFEDNPDWCPRNVSGHTAPDSYQISLCLDCLKLLP